MFCALNLIPIQGVGSQAEIIIDQVEFPTLLRSASLKIGLIKMMNWVNEIKNNLFKIGCKILP